MIGELKAKFRVHNNHESAHDGTKYAEKVSMSPVYSSDPNSENHQYAKATPCGAIELTITNPNAFGFLEEQGEYLITIRRAEPSQ